MNELTNYLPMLLALVLAVVALAVACLALYRTLPPGEDDPQEPGERAESPTISYRDRELPVLEGVAVNSYVSDGFSVNDRGWLTYEQDGAIWYKGADFTAKYAKVKNKDDEQPKDEVLVRQNGNPTYMTADIAYHKNKFDRGFDRCIDIWGADHHGHVARMKGAMDAIGCLLYTSPSPRDCS